MISKEEIIKKIGNLLEDLAVKFDRISNPKNDVHPLEFELFEVQASYFAEHTSILRKLEEETAKHNKEAVETLSSDTKSNTEDQPQEEERVEPETKEEIVFTPPIQEEISEEETLDSQDTEEEIPEQEESPAPAAPSPAAPTPAAPAPAKQEPREEKVSEDVSPSTEVDSPVVAVESNEAKEAPATQESVDPKPSLEEVVNKVVIEEKKVNVVSDKPMSLNDRLFESRKSMAESTTVQREAPSRIRDIKSVISLNDKLMFIKDLFNGYSLAYSEAIELLNRFETFDDAQRFLQTNYAEKNSWQTKQASVDKLNAILRKRYGS